MENPKRASGIPRPSRLPVLRPVSSIPRPVPSPRPADASEPLIVAETTPIAPSRNEDLHTRKLRPTSSISQLRSRAVADGYNGTSSMDIIDTSTHERTSARTLTKSTSKTLASRPVKPRESLKVVTKQPSLPAIRQASNRKVSPSPERKKTFTPAKKERTANGPSETILTARKSSAALREQIAAAKAARRAVSKPLDTSQNLSATDAFPAFAVDDSFDPAHPDPFNQGKKEPAGTKVLKQRVAVGRTTGKLNIAALGLHDIPSEVLKMYELESIDGGSANWAESVDLTRLIAADNELTELADGVFPDVASDVYNVEEDAPVNLFAGVETLDLHGNKLRSLPMGFRRLNFLTSLNLSSNSLTNDCFDVIAQMISLRDLKMANNSLAGELNSSISQLESLEILDVHGNKLTRLPPSIGGLSRLRILDLSDNSFETVDCAPISQLPLTELILKKNKLRGTLLDSSVESFAMLQSFDISSNQIKEVATSNRQISFPALHTFSMSMNRLQELPDMSQWTSLITLTAAENNIADLPVSFFSLTKLRQADFSSNDLRTIPPEISRMQNLSSLRLGGNPLRDKKFLTATTEDIKEVLAGRLEPPPPYQEQGSKDKAQGEKTEGYTGVDEYGSEDDKFATPPTSAPQSPARSRRNTVGKV